MGKIAVLSGKEVWKILARHGFEEVRRRGSHVVMQRRTPAGTTNRTAGAKELADLFKLSQAVPTSALNGPWSIYARKLIDHGPFNSDVPLAAECAAATRESVR